MRFWSSAVDDAKQMTCENNHFLRLGRLVDGNRTMRVRIFIRPKGSCEEVSKRLSFCLWLFFIGKDAFRCIKCLSNQLNSNVGRAKGAGFPDGDFDFSESLKDCCFKVAT